MRELVSPSPLCHLHNTSPEPAAQQPGLVQHHRPSPRQPPFLCPAMALGFMVLLLAGMVGTGKGGVAERAAVGGWHWGMAGRTGLHMADACLRRAVCSRAVRCDEQDGG